MIEAQERTSDENILLAPPVPGVTFIRTLAATKTLDRELVILCKFMSEAYINGVNRLRQDSSLNIMALNLNCVHENDLKQVLNPENINSLIRSGFIEKRPFKEFEYIYIPKLPELFAYLTIDYLEERLFNKFQSDFDSSYKELISICEFILYGDLTAAKVILQMSKKDPNIFSSIINKLLNDEPVIHVSSGAKELMMYLDPHQVNIKVENGVETKMYENIFPYLVLSNLIGVSFKTTEDNPNNYRFNCLARIAKSKALIRRVDTKQFHEGFPYYDYPGIGELLDGSIGIIEPITFSLAENLSDHPEEFYGMYLYLKETKSYNALNRIYTAVKNMNSIPTSNVDDVRKIILSQVPEILLEKIQTINDKPSIKRTPENSNITKKKIKRKKTKNLLKKKK